MHEISICEGGILAYGLRQGVKYSLTEGRPTLTLSFPLKLIRLDPVWDSVFTQISSYDTMPLQVICDLVDHVHGEEVARFLNTLVRKGFLKRAGVEELSIYPQISVVVPVRNRPEEISRCLRSLEGLEYPFQKKEVIVVDDSSEDETPHVVAGFPVKLISLEERRHASFCRNLAAREAVGEILAFIDSDCLADPRWLKDLVPAFKDPSVGAVGGLVDSSSDNRGLDRYEKVRSSLRVSSWYRRSEENDKFFYVPSCNLLVRRDLFLSLGGFREDLHVGEDVDFCWRVQNHGCHVEYRPVGKIDHQHRNRPMSFCLRRFDYGTSEPLLQKLHPGRIKLFTFPSLTVLFWFMVILSISFYSISPAVLAFIIFGADLSRTALRIRMAKIPVSFLAYFKGTSRSYLFFLYHVCAFVSRYYLLWAIVLFPLLSGLSFIILGMHLVTGVVEFLVKRPVLSFLQFLFYFTLEQLSYQAGVWWGCLRHLRFGAVIPRIKLR